ncbi:peptide chain release factor N(5)-glutamine methyltransferase [Breznakiella homolactica]|uniref:Release factor glutamine methyltransferase n=1 Tax=Breznakiella homolactica TaxID=2798577 RepID=A0A7T7XQJ2_9SPIR|nr:peptide chain release factor N(5)-glutamine methyltransferase [Breznakiella homolactica]QQO10662.1 peptide chain release factor N(5)-glutamine methyltransferase [Breznakiella homolactica]
MTRGEALSQGTALLAAAGIGTPRLDASLILADILGIDRSYLLVHDGMELPEENQTIFDEHIQRRIAGENVAYITGHKEFWGLDFFITPDVLVPRPDTEILVEAAIAEIRKMPAASRTGPLRVLDLCTGSGAVAVAVKHEIPDISVSASDISEAALAVAEENARRLLGGKPESRSISFFRSDLLRSLPGKFDLIVSNPPYVPGSMISGLDREVRHEPRLALDGGADGLDYIRRIIAEAPEKMNSPAKLLLEADPRQMPAIAVILGEHRYTDIEVHRDLSGKDRVIGAAFPD